MPLALDEPLAESAPLAQELSKRCRIGPDGVSCAWSHGLWQYLRLLGLVTSPSHQAEFYRAAFARLAVPSPRVLVSGAADYSMLAVVLAACRSSGAEPAVTVIDVCETPLALSRWYAARASAAIETHAADIRDFTAREPFDVVCSDNFFGRFPRAERPAVAARWASLLRRDGVAVTVNRIRAEGGEGPVRFSSAQASAFVETVRQAARASAALSALGEQIADRAAAYAQRHFTYPMSSAEELRGDFESAGFAVEQLDTASAAGGNRQASSGPSVRGFQSYARLVARRA